MSRIMMKSSIYSNEINNKIYLARLHIYLEHEFYGLMINELKLEFVVTSGTRNKVSLDNHKIIINEDYINKVHILTLTEDILFELKKYVRNIIFFKAFYTSSNQINNGTQKVKHSGGISGDLDTLIEKDDNEEEDSLKSDIEEDKRKLSSIAESLKASGNYSKIPDDAKKLIVNKPSKKINWREELKKYIVTDYQDYTFIPPDKRFSSGDILLPGYNDTEESLKDIVFMIDVSESMKEDTISKVFSEVKNAISSFRGRVNGYVGWFNTKVLKVIDIKDLSTNFIKNIRGGGGTSFVDIFDFVERKLDSSNIKALVILTDGYGELPVKKYYNYDVIWVMTTDSKQPFGKLVKYKGGNIYE